MARLKSVKAYTGGRPNDGMSTTRTRTHLGVSVWDSISALNAQTRRVIPSHWSDKLRLAVKDCPILHVSLVGYLMEFLRIFYILINAMRSRI